MLEAIVTYRRIMDTRKRRIFGVYTPDSDRKLPLFRFSYTRIDKPVWKYLYFYVFNIYIFFIVEIY
jgi:hypothetical protein